MRIEIFVPLISLCEFVKAEERLSWFSTDPEIKKRIFVPDNLSEGKEENRVLPWVFHDNEIKQMELKCIMRGYNASNNPIGYKEARWSHPGFSDSQVDTTTEPTNGTEGADPYRMWTIKITTSKADAGKKWATCDFQQGDFPLSIDIMFLIFRKVAMPKDQNSFTYDLGDSLDESYFTKQVEEDVKKQISKYYSLEPSSVTRSAAGQFIITLPSPPVAPVVVETTPPPLPIAPVVVESETKPGTLIPIVAQAPATAISEPTSTQSPLVWLSNFIAQILNLVFVQLNPFYHLFIGPSRSLQNYHFWGSR